MYVFQTLSKVRNRTENWLREYSEERPHDSLGDIAPWEYLAKYGETENSSVGRH
jgi:putative transposase